LTDRVWARFLAVELQRRRIAEVARAEGVSPNAVWQSVRKARAAVRAISRASAR
jgi:DNA-directed RNA polymerase specialized sigma24 family protein